MTLSLHGNSLEFINKVSISVLVGMIGVTLLGALVDYILLRRKNAHRESGKEEAEEEVNLKPRVWSLALLIASYVVLIPGLTTLLFSFQIGALDTLDLKHSTDTTLSFALLMAKTGSWIGCVLLIFFATVIPVLKLLMLIVGFILHAKGTKQSLIWSRRSILFVQTISKWACPDMFAYILMQYLTRSLNHPPTLQGLMQLDVGFTCFSCFCVASTISSIGARVPDVDDKGYENCVKKIKDCERAALKPFVQASGIVTVPLFIAFAVLMIVGITMPAMKMRIDVDTLFENGTIPEAARGFVESLHLQELANADVSIWRCSLALVDWMHDGEATSIFAFVMLSIGCIVVPILDMIVLLAAGLTAQFAKDSLRILKCCQELTSVLRKLAMLDVFLAGVVLVVISGKIYSEQGLVLAMAEGMKVLLGAEICHFLTQLFVSHVIKMRLQEARSQTVTDKKMEVEDDEEMQHPKKSHSQLPALLNQMQKGVPCEDKADKEFCEPSITAADGPPTYSEVTCMPSTTVDEPHAHSDDSNDLVLDALHDLDDDNDLAARRLSSPVFHMEI
eukprot:TRINITY_DN83132_c0_g1_i1.p1 TRINITY_DN83132_c0_g1~~TRINITY_DN83132_c0_g1_i1.p1  ORF type:complete len:561 (+),score=77.94 TRINITY_DN83132_c0_g1_i1:97-1779(+)